MALKKQLSLFKSTRSRSKLKWIQSQKVYGGSLNYRKVRRPFDRNRCTHVVMKAVLPSSFSFIRDRKRIESVIRKYADAYQVRIFISSINSNHLHFLLTANSAYFLQSFMRQIAAQLSRYYIGAFAKMGLKVVESIWTERPFTRLVERGVKAFSIVKNYIMKNRNESHGLESYAPRKDPLHDFLRSWNYRKTVSVKPNSSLSSDLKRPC